MNLSYYPGCTLKTKGRGLETSALAAMQALDVNLIEIDRWNCCGTVYSLADDDLVHYLAPVRNLIRAKQQGFDKVVTLCSFCYNTLKRANLLMQKNPEKQKTVSDFLDEGIDYKGEVKVVHLLEVLRDDIGWKNVSQKLKNPLKGLKVAPYYGCTLLRPLEAAIDQVERPAILQDFIGSLGAEAINFPFANECCGSFQIVGNPEFAARQSREILSSALRRGAEALVVTCPLCDFNLNKVQAELQLTSDSGKMPIFYFSQLLALALGLGPEVCHFELNSGEPLTLLKSKKLL
jgi:heterodisulfide reductase subunit B2